MFKKKKFYKTVDKKDLDYYIEKNPKKNAVESLQSLKEEMVENIFSPIKMPCLSSVKMAENSYLKELSRYQTLDNNNFFAQSDEFKRNFKNAFKKQDLFSVLSPSYLGNFQQKTPMFLAWLKLYESRKPDMYGEKDFFQETRKIEALPNCARDVFFDEEIFYQEISQKNQGEIKCFYEEDYNENKNFFSLNELLNYLSVFWLELWYPNINEISEKIRVKYFPNIERKIKFVFAKKFISELRDKQENIIFSLPDYEQIEGKLMEKFNGKIAEKIVELEFKNLIRELEKKFELKIKIINPSPGEDLVKKEDLIVVVYKNGKKRRKEIQITLNSQNYWKKKLVEDIKQEYCQKNWTPYNFLVFKFKLNNIVSRYHFWQINNRPIAGLEKLFDEEKREEIKDYFKELIENLNQELESE